VGHGGGGLGEVLLGSRHGAARNRKRSVKRHQRATNLAVRGRVDLPALGAVEEIVDHVKGTLAVKAMLGSVVVAKVLGTLVVQRRLVEVETVVGRRLRCVVASRVSARVLEVGAHLTIVIVVAGRLVHVRPVVHAALGLGLLVGADEDRVIRVRLDVLLQVLRTFEGLAAELTLVRLQGHMHTDVGSDVVSLDGGSAARVPLASEVEIVGALATNMALTDVLIKRLGA